VRLKRIKDVELGRDHYGAGNNDRVERINNWRRYESEKHGQSFDQIFRYGADLHEAPQGNPTALKVRGDVKL
jgi:hypothetical protein